MSQGAILQAIDEGRTDEVLRGLSSDEPGTRAFAAGGIASLSVAEGAGPLAGLLADSNWIVRASAAAAAGELGVRHEELEAALLGALDDSEVVVVRLAIQALGKLESDSAVPRLVEFVREGAAELSGEAIVALGKIGDGRATPQLIEELEGVHLSSAIEALGQIGDERAFNPLVARFEAGVNGFDEWYIVAALRDIGSRERIYTSMESHPDPETRRMLGRVAGEWWPDEDAVRALIHAMSDEAATVRSGAAFRLGDHNLPEALHDDVKAALRSGLDDENEDVRHWCTETLEEWGTE